MTWALTGASTVWLSSEAPVDCISATGVGAVHDISPVSLHVATVTEKLNSEEEKDQEIRGGFGVLTLAPAAFA